MDQKKLAQLGNPDTVKLVGAVAILLLGIVLYYMLGNQPLLIRVPLVLASAGVAVWVVSTTAQGAALFGFMRESRNELRRVTWPTRQETLHTSLAVMAMVLVMGIFLWLLDMLLFWIVRLLIGG
jgi:preprotein translocase subunit SecE